MKKDLISLYKNDKSIIESKISDFKSLPEKDYFKEFMFCLLTPQSNAKKCWDAVEKLENISLKETKKIEEILKTRTRFYKTKAVRLSKAQEAFNQILPILNNTNRISLRNKIQELVNGYGLKEAGHFLRNIGKSDNQIAILDRHILRNLESIQVIEMPKSMNKRSYLELEQKFLKFSKEIGIPIDHLDILFWSKETGEVFK